MPRPRAWADTLVNQDLTTTQANFDLTLNLAPTDTSTLVRLVVHLNMFPDDIPTAGETIQSIALGIQTVSAEAFAAAVMPDPDVAADVPALGWLWRDNVGEFTQTTNSVIDSYHYPEIKYDGRAARKVDRGVVALTVQKTIIVGVAHDLRMVGIVRALYLM